MITSWHYQITVSDVQVGKTIKALFISWLIPQRIRGALRMKQHFRVNDHEVPTNYVLKTGDVLTLLFENDDFRTSESHYLPNDKQQVAIVFENDDFVIVDKPAGMKMHPHSITETDTLLNYLAANFQMRQLLSASAQAKPYMVHRIDRETSGLVIVAKNPVVVPILNRLLSEKIIKRTYLAWVTGAMGERNGSINVPIGVDFLNDRKRWINGIDAQTAITHWTCIHTVYQNSLLRLQLETGRMHQIRVHLASVGHPIIGDSLYGSQSEATRMMLHSVSIELPLPFDGGHKIITGALPDDFPRQLMID